MATLTTQAISRAGITPSYAAVAGGGDACEVGDDIYLHFKNTNAATCTVTLAIPATTGDKLIGPVGALFKDPTTGLCTITYSGTSTNTTVAVCKLQAP